jgi:3-oxoacyl-(acyl-carrier-protein) synthase
MTPTSGSPRRVWITGHGLITAMGIGLPAVRAGLRAGRRIDRFDPQSLPLPGYSAGRDFEPLDSMEPKTACQLDRFSQFGLVAGQLALADARLVPGHGRRCHGRADRDVPGQSS